MISKSTLQAIMPRITAENLEKFYEPINEAMVKWEINTPRRMAMFLAQLAHESGSFRYVRELANGTAYEGRNDLGNIHPGDGPKYKGRGLIQITGRVNYENYFASVGLPASSDPLLLEGALHASNSAGWFWNMRGLNEIADHPDDWQKEWRGNMYDCFEWVTLKINGGQNGIADRRRYYENAKKALGI